MTPSFPYLACTHRAVCCVTDGAYYIPFFVMGGWIGATCEPLSGDPSPTCLYLVRRSDASCPNRTLSPLHVQWCPGPRLRPPVSALACRYLNCCGGPLEVQGDRWCAQHPREGPVEAGGPRLAGRHAGPSHTGGGASAPRDLRPTTPRRPAGCTPAVSAASDAATGDTPA